MQSHWSHWTFFAFFFFSFSEASHSMKNIIGRWWHAPTDASLYPPSHSLNAQVVPPPPMLLLTLHGGNQSQPTSMFIFKLPPIFLFFPVKSLSLFLFFKTQVYPIFLTQRRSVSCCPFSWGGMPVREGWPNLFRTFRSVAFKRSGLRVAAQLFISRQLEPGRSKPIFLDGLARHFPSLVLPNFLNCWLFFFFSSSFGYPGGIEATRIKKLKRKGGIKKKKDDRSRFCFSFSRFSNVI